MKLRFGEPLILILLVTLLYAGAYIPIIKNYQHTPKDRIYLGFAEYPIDTVGDIELIRQGFDGSWMRNSPFTTAIQSPPTFLKEEYILIGHFARLFALTPITAYKFAVFVLSVSFLFSIFFLLSNIFSKSVDRITAAILIFFATGITLPGQQLGWAVMESDSLVFQRMTTAVPHYLLGSIFSILSVLLLAKTLDSFSQKHLFFASIFGFFAAWIFMPAMILVFLALPFYYVFFLFNRPYKKSLTHTRWFFFIYVLVSHLPAWYIRYVSTFYDWNRWAHTETLFPIHLKPIDYLLIIGPVLLIAVIILPYVLTKGSTILKIAASIVIAHPIAVFVVAPLIGSSQIRFFQAPYYVWYGIIATFAISKILKLFPFHGGETIKFSLSASTQVVSQTSSLHRENNGLASGKRSKFSLASSAAVMLVFLFILLPSWYTYKLSFGHNEVCFCANPGFDIGYPKKTVLEAFSFIDSHSTSGDIVLSMPFAGELIPAFTHNRVYMSWWYRLTEPPQYWTDFTNVQSYYLGKLSEEQANSFVTKNNIDYVYYGFEESGANNSVFPYRHLKKIFGNTDSTIYEVLP